MEIIGSFNPEKLKKYKIIRSYYVEDNNLIIELNDGNEEYFYKDGDKYVKLDIPKGYSLFDLCDSQFAILIDHDAYSDRKYCYLNKLNGTILDNNVYEECCPFLKGAAIVKLNGKYGLINEDGEIIFPIEYDNMSFLSDNKIIVKKDGKCACFDKDGKVIKKFSNNRMYGLGNGFAKYYTSRRNYVVDEYFNKKFEYDWIFSSSGPDEKYFLYKGIDGKYHVYTNGGKFFHLTSEFDYLNFRFVSAETDDDPFFVNYDFKYYSYMLYLPNKKIKRFKAVLPFNNGYAFVIADEYGFQPFILIDKKGKKICDTDYNECIEYQDGLYLFKKVDDTYVIVNYKNDLIKYLERKKLV